MKDSILVQKSKTFSVDIIRLCDKMKGHNALVNQLLRSGTSIGANIHESIFAQGTNDFISKLQIALKECSETEYWLYIIKESGIYVIDNDLINKCIEIKRLLISSINTIKSK